MLTENVKHKHFQFIGQGWDEILSAKKRQAGVIKLSNKDD